MSLKLINIMFERIKKGIIMELRTVKDVIGFYLRSSGPQVKSSETQRPSFSQEKATGRKKERAREREREREREKWVKACAIRYSWRVIRKAYHSKSSLGTTKVARFSCWLAGWLASPKIHNHPLLAYPNSILRGIALAPPHPEQPFLVLYPLFHQKARVYRKLYSKVKEAAAAARLNGKPARALQRRKRSPASSYDFYRSHNYKFLCLMLILSATTKVFECKPQLQLSMLPK